jgi:thioredoxin 1
MKANFDSIINNNKPVIVDFHALWCGPCKAQSPVLKELAMELNDKIRVIKIDVDQNKEIAAMARKRRLPLALARRRAPREQWRRLVRMDCAKQRYRANFHSNERRECHMW